MAERQIGRALEQAVTAEVEALLPPGTRVETWLVLAYEDDGVQAARDGVRVCNHEGFRQRFLPGLRAERGDAGEIHQQVADIVWGWGRGERALQSPPSACSGPAREARPRAVSAPASTGGIRERLPNASTRWTREEEDELRRLDEAGRDARDLARRFGRTPGAVRSRLRRIRR